MRSVDNTNCYQTVIVGTKTRVAPLKSMTIPKLELKAATLGVQLVLRLSTVLKIDLKTVHSFTDSTIVLCWLFKQPCTWKTFVANRVEKVLKIVPFRKWFYVPTKENPSDLPTQGLTVTEFQSNLDFWVHEPSFLRRPDAYKVYKIPNIDTHAALEKQKERAVA